MIDKNKVFSVLIIGCGNIAGFKVSNITNYLMTHAGAFNQNINFRLTACIDKDLKKANIFKKKWQIPKAFSSIDEVIKRKERYDVVSICSPTDTHFYQLKKSVLLKPKLVFCEKPLTYKLVYSKKIVRLYKKNKIALAVNYTRRWGTDIINLKKSINEGEWGEIVGVSCQYTKGLFNNGSHMIDLLIFLFGNFKIKWVGNKIFDYWKKDPTMSFILRSEKKFDVTVNGIEFNNYNLFEMKIYTKKGVISMEDSGLKWTFIRNNHKKNNYFLDVYKKKGRINHSMIFAIKNINDYLRSNFELACDGEISLKSMEICEKLFRFNNV